MLKIQKVFVVKLSNLKLFFFIFLLTRNNNKNKNYPVLSNYVLYLCNIDFNDQK